MNLKELLEQIKKQPQNLAFADVIATIESNYEFTAVAFSNGELKNDAGQNAGSCKIFAFGLLNGLSEAQTLACFGHYYRDDVLGNPDGSDHGNIRNFIKTGWAGISFSADALVLKV